MTTLKATCRICRTEFPISTFDPMFPKGPFMCVKCIAGRRQEGDSGEVDEEAGPVTIEEGGNDGGVVGVRGKF